MSQTYFANLHINQLVILYKFANLIDIAPYLSDEQSNIISNIQDPSKFADKAISLLNISTQEKQLILEELDIA